MHTCIHRSTTYTNYILHPLNSNLHPGGLRVQAVGRHDLGALAQREALAPEERASGRGARDGPCRDVPVAGLVAARLHQPERPDGADALGLCVCGGVASGRGR